VVSRSFSIGFSFFLPLFFNMSSPSSSLRKRGGKKETYTAVPSDNASLLPAVAAARQQSEWDYWLAMIVLTVLAFATRFYRIDYPNEVVFDEVHFGKVCF
jgi:dolichyl-phosphate-mannose-protein mannosyltransferase